MMTALGGGGNSPCEVSVLDLAHGCFWLAIVLFQHHAYCSRQPNVTSLFQFTG